jgi:hypothetical protein
LAIGPAARRIALDPCVGRRAQPAAAFRQSATEVTVRVLARNVSGSAFDLGAATLSVAITK